MAAPELDFASFPVGGAITLGDVTLVRTPFQDKMKAFAAPDAGLMVVSKDPLGNSLVAIKGDWSTGALQVDAANTAVAFWMPRTQWEQLCPYAAIQVGDAIFIRYDVVERVTRMATHSKELQVVAPDWHGFQLVADEGDLTRGLLMVDGDHAAVGYWMPKAEFDALATTPPTAAAQPPTAVEAAPPAPTATENHHENHHDPAPAPHPAAA